MPKFFTLHHNKPLIIFWRMKNILLSLRLEQWIKNGFVLMPLVFSHHLMDRSYLSNALIFTLAFCLVSSSIYLLNDIIDKTHDQAHPDKKLRPIAAGLVSPRIALPLSLLLSVAAICISFVFARSALHILLIYLANNILYSFFLKRIVVLDVILIAIGFVLRVIGGAEAIGVEASVWLIICTFLISLFLGFCKRKQELLALASHSGEHRRVLEDYNINYLDHMISVVSACTVLSYVLYTVSDDTVGKFDTEHLYFSVPFVIYGIFRYMYHINVLESRKSTSQILLGDKLLLLNIVLWLTVSIGLIY